MVLSEGVFTICAWLITIRCTTLLKATRLVAGSALLLYLAYTIGGTTALGVAAITGSVASRLPQIMKAWKASDISGISGSSWLVLLVANSLWAIAGLQRRDPVLFLGGFLSALSSILVLILPRFHRKAPQP